MSSMFLDLNNLRSHLNVEELLVLMRHGRTSANELGLLQGHANYPLSEKGKADAANGAENIYRQLIEDLVRQTAADEKVIIVIARSDLDRAVETSEITAQTLSKLSEDKVTCILLEPDNRLKERSFGPYEEKPKIDFQNAQTAAFKQALIIGRTATWDVPSAPGVESDGSLFTRLVPGLLDAHTRARGIIGKHKGFLLVCGHGSAFRTVGSFILGHDSGEVSNGGHIVTNRNDIRAITEILATKYPSFSPYKD